MDEQAPAPALDAVTILALSKCIKPKELAAARPKVSASSNPINCLVRLHGVLTVKPDTPGSPAVPGYYRAGEFDPWALLAVAIKYKPGASVARLAKAAAKASVDTAAIKAAFCEHVALLPKQLVPGCSASAGSFGAVSFEGQVKLEQEKSA